jgi:hypothetical protein
MAAEGYPVGISDPLSNRVTLDSTEDGYLVVRLDGLLLAVFDEAGFPVAVEQPTVARVAESLAQKEAGRATVRKKRAQVDSILASVETKHRAGATWKDATRAYLAEHFTGWDKLDRDSREALVSSYVRRLRTRRKTKR